MFTPTDRNERLRMVVQHANERAWTVRPQACEEVLFRLEVEDGAESLPGGSLPEDAPFLVDHKDG